MIWSSRSPSPSFTYFLLTLTLCVCLHPQPQPQLCLTTVQEKLKLINEHLNAIKYKAQIYILQRIYTMETAPKPMTQMVYK